MMTLRAPLISSRRRIMTTPPGKDTPLVVDGYLMPGATLTRASEAWDWGSDGLIYKVANNTPIIGYNPATLVRRGVAIRKAWTNSLKHNRDLSQVWTNNGATKDATGADGVANKAWTFSGTDDASQAITVTDNSLTNQASWLLEKAGGVAILSGAYTGGTTTLDYQATIDTSDGSKTAGGDAVDGNITVTDRGDWWQVDIACANNTTGNTTFTVKTDVSSGTIVQDFPGIYLNSSYAGPPIETGASAVTREADDIVINPIFSGYNQAEGTIVANALSIGASGAGDEGVFVFNDGTINNFIVVDFFNTTNAAFRVTNGGASQVNMDIGSGVSGEFKKIAAAYKVNDFAASINGKVVATDTSGSLPTIDRCLIGQDRTNKYLEGWLDQLTYYGRRLANAQLESLSS